jgi:hypothetical protein
MPGCAPSGRAFLAARTSIDILDGPLCGAGVVDNSTCRPGDFGRGHWTRHGDFPPFTVSQYYGRGDVRLLSASLRAHYLGSIYYDGDLHSYCKHIVDPDLFRDDATFVQEYDLVRLIEERVVRRLTTRLHDALSSSMPDHAGAIAARFYGALMEELTDRISARVLWFVSRYSGGIVDMAHNVDLQRCLWEAHVHDAGVVTGVAGYIVLAEHIDSGVAAVDVVHRALYSASTEYTLSLDGAIRESLAREWTVGVGRIASVRVSRTETTATVWPLWVQFEH